MNNTDVEIVLIGAAGWGNIIGRGGALPWAGELPSDMRYFKERTTGFPVIMGRKTFDSLPVKPLPKRMNIVLSRHAPYDVVPAMAKNGGFFWAHSVEDALARVRTHERAFVIGGEEIYRMFLPFARTVYLTRIHRKFAGDARFPVLSKNEWKLHTSERWPAFEDDKHPYSFQTFKRIT
jgi:dihydrofolate reductase